MYYPSVPEDTPAGKSVVQIQATDYDKDENQNITFKITSGAAEGLFTINSSSGKYCFYQTYSQYFNICMNKLNTT